MFVSRDDNSQDGSTTITTTTTTTVVDADGIALLFSARNINATSGTRFVSRYSISSPSTRELKHNTGTRNIRNNSYCYLLLAEHAADITTKTMSDNCIVCGYFKEH